jgi:3-hydroxyisobutyrate dehydrogenase-like beta-hydroxyacid dehydrogenase
LADSALLRRIYPQMLQRAFEPPKSYARLLEKDLKAAKTFAHDLGLDLPMVATAAERYATFAAQGGAMRDSAAIVDLYETTRRKAGQATPD